MASTGQSMIIVSPIYIFIVTVNQCEQITDWNYPDEVSKWQPMVQTFSGNSRDKLSRPVWIRDGGSGRKGRGHNVRDRPDAQVKIVDLIKMSP